MSLQELTGQADRVKQTLALGTPETRVCLEAMRDTVGLINDTRRESYHLSTKSSLEPFQRLERIFIALQYVMERSIGVLGQLDRDFDCIVDVTDLIDSLGTHIGLIENAESLRANVVPAQDALRAIGPSLKNIRSLVATLHTSVDKLYRRYREENPQIRI
jgi:hypothetical protein